MNWSNIKLSQYYDLISLDQNSYETKLDFQCDFLSIALDVPVEEIEDFDFSKISEYSKSLTFIATPPTIFNGVLGYTIVPFTKIKLGEFIDLEYYLQQPESLPYILAILFKQTKVNEWNEVIFEPYKYSLENRKEFLNNQMANVWAVLNNYIPCHNNVR
jgi:hypothetical protein